jgi:teichuronic acid biosynthesis glycosyltransferase TuaG
MRSKNAVLTYTAYNKMDVNGLIGSGVVWVKDSLNYNELLYNTLGCLTVIYDQEALGKMYMTSIGHEDFLLWLQILKKGYTAYGLNEPLAIYRTNNKSISGNKFKASGFVWNIYRNVEHLPLLTSCICFVKYAFLSYKKYRIS